MKLLLTGAFNYSAEQIKSLRAVGNDIIFIQDERVPLNIDVSEIDGVICNGLFLYNDIKQFKNLKYIQLISAGYDRIPLDYIKDKKIKVFNARGVYSVPMAEFAIGGILQLVKRFDLFYENKKKHVWNKSRTLGELFGKTSVIVGAGNIGSEIAKRLKAFDMTVIGVDIFNDSRLYFDKIELLDNLNDQLKIADIFILTLPLTDSTANMFDKTKFSIMKDTSIFVNVARGQLVNENDLIDALTKKEIAGAVLDVFNSEPLDEKSPLWDFDNVILTPHNSFVGENNNKRMFDVIFKNLETFCK